MREIDRNGWGSGPWDGEPDREDWTDETTGYPCVALRTDLGNWCGYVGLPNVVSFFGVHHDELYDIEVHGGLTFSGAFHDYANVWFFGFDCNHGFDFAPFSLSWGQAKDFNSYRTLPYVKAQVKKLAEQLHALFDAEEGEE